MTDFRKDKYSEQRIRFYDPHTFDVDKFIRKNVEQVVAYCDETLKRMNRNYTTDDFEKGVEFSEENTKKELLAILEKTGYTITSATKRLSKAELVALIEEQFSDEPVDEVEAPSFEDDGVVE